MIHAPVNSRGHMKLRQELSVMAEENKLKSPK